MPERITELPERLDRFLVQLFSDHSRTKLTKLIEEGLVTVDGVVITKSGFALKPGQTVSFPDPQQTPTHDLTPANIPVDVVYEDETMMVVNKPRGMAAHPAPGLKSPSLVNALLAIRTELSQEAGAFRPGIVHRLDKDTTGLMMIAKTDSAHRFLAAQIQSKSAERRYVCVAQGDFDNPKFRIEAPLARDPSYRVRMRVDGKGREAATEFKVLHRLDAGTLLGAKLETGRTHQIRVHLRSIGHPVVGDDLYGPDNVEHLPIQLHAAFLSFRSLVERTVDRTLYCAPPDDFLGAQFVHEQQLAKW
jgi:23S rRNA pseudouridine1911/1915/1917 synthase